jgi:hypothetical protein
VLVFSYIGFTSQEVPLNGQTNFNVRLKSAAHRFAGSCGNRLRQPKKESLTGAISSVTSKDIDRVHGGSTVSTALAGKIPGVTFRQSEGRPGASANIRYVTWVRRCMLLTGFSRTKASLTTLRLKRYREHLGT